MHHEHNANKFACFDRVMENKALQNVCMYEREREKKKCCMKVEWSKPNNRLAEYPVLNCMWNLISLYRLQPIQKNFQKNHCS